MAVSERWIGGQGTFGAAELPFDAYRDDEERVRRAMAAELSWQASLIDAVPQAIITTDLNGLVTSVNRFAEAMYGFTAAEAIGRHVGDLVYRPEEAGLAMGVIAQVAKGATVSRERQVLRKNGQPIWIAVTASPVRSPSGTVTHVVATSADITERLRLEAQYRQAQKMEAVGRLAGGVAHDFNNLLTVMRANAEFLSRALPPDGELRQDLDEIVQSVDRASALTRQLLAFSRQQVTEPVVVKPNEIVSGLEKMLSRLIGEDIDLQVDLHPAVPTVCVDPGQLEQAIANLVVNARDAMPAGGPLTIRTGRLEIIDATDVSHGGAGVGVYATIEVVDTGTGMSAAIRARIFEPFFTTKETGRGTGLGLASVYGMVKQCGGFIDVASTEGKGSTFTIGLPACSPVPLPPGTEGPAEDVRGNGEIILLVEDQEEVRSVISRILVRHGYRVIESTNGVEALAHVDRDGIDIELLVTDAIMPRMGGARLITAIRKRHPELPVLMVSGYTDNELVSQGIGVSDVELMRKPFRPDDLLRRVKSLLSGVPA